MSRRLLLSSLLKYRRNHLFFSNHSFASFSSQPHDRRDLDHADRLAHKNDIDKHDDTIRVRSSLRNVRPNWEHVKRRVEQFLEREKDIDARILQSRLPHFLLECIRSEHEEAGPLAGRLLNMVGQQQPSAEVMQMTIEAWLKSGHVGGLQEAERILMQMLQRASHDCPPSAMNGVAKQASADYNDRINAAFALVVYALLKVDQVSRASRLVACIQHLFDSRRPNHCPLQLQPNTTACNAMLTLWAKQGKVESVSNLLHHMIRQEDNDSSSRRSMIAPNNVSFNSAVVAHAKRGDPQGAAAIVRLMLERHKQQQLSEAPGIITFNSLLDAWTRSGDRNAGERAEEVQQWMERERVQPDTRSYNRVIDAHAKSGSPIRAEKVLRYLIGLRENGIDIGPDEHSFTAVVHAWATSKHVMSATSRAERASDIIQLMEDLRDLGYDGSLPAASPYNALISAWAVAAREDEGHCREIMNVLDRMNGRSDIVPNTRTYSSILSALVRSGKNGVDKALQFLRDLEHRMVAGDASVVLDTSCYNTVLSGLIRSKRADASKVAEQLRQHMIRRQQESGDCSVGPNTVTYNSIMTVLATPELAESELDQMEERYKSGIQQVKPTAVSYTTCISAWAKSKNDKKVKRAQALLERMKDAYNSGNVDARVDLLAYNALLRCCSYPVGDANVQKHVACVVIDTLKEMRESDHANPNHVSYASALRAFGRCLPPGKDRDDLVEIEFRNCCNDGQLNEAVLLQLRNASFNVYTKLFGKERVDDVIRKIPRAWLRNASFGKMTIGTSMRPAQADT